MPKLESLQSPPTKPVIKPPVQPLVKRPPPKPPQAIEKKPALVDEAKIIYPDLEFRGYWVGNKGSLTYGELENLCKAHPHLTWAHIQNSLGEKECGPITWELAKQWLGWETGTDYEKRTGEPLPDFLFQHDGQKIVCWNNLKNRPFNETHTRELAQDILMRNWAGPTTLPTETVNGETIVIGRTGQVISGQHRLIALILARLMWWQSQNKWLHLWKTEPVIESIVVFGASEAKDVIKTIDNVMPRSVSDVFYTSDVFKDQNLTNAARKELSRMLERTLQTLWKRTGAGMVHGSKNYQTHSSAMEFFTHHKTKMLQALKVIYNINKSEGKTPRGITLLRLSPGNCAALLYLMGCCKSDGDVYRNDSPPSEKGLDWEMWDKAVEFWTELGDGQKILGEGTSANPKCHLPEIKQALSLLVEDGTQSLNPILSNAIIARAWKLYSCNEPLGGLPELTKDPNENSKLYNQWFKSWLPMESRDGKSVLLEPMDFEGIDLGEPSHKVDEKPDPKETKEAKQKEKEAKRKDAAEKAKAKLAAKKAGGTAASEEDEQGGVEGEDTDNANVIKLREELNNIKRASNCNLLIFKTVTGFVTKDIDAKEVNRITKWKLTEANGWLARVEFDKKQYDEAVPRLLSAGFSVGVVDSPTKDSGFKVTKVKKEDLKPGTSIKKCIACSGTGKSSKGLKCTPCKGTGKVTDLVV